MLLAVGRVLSTVHTLSGVFDAVLVLPILSAAKACRSYCRSETVVVFHEQPHGAAVLLHAVLHELLPDGRYW